ncbi:hypothetical protein C7M52_02797 [Mixta theicola]|nr:hypothetical protein C7M52_02797 [Mixta theicola]
MDSVFIIVIIILLHAIFNFSLDIYSVFSYGEFGPNEFFT